MITGAQASAGARPFAWHALPVREVLARTRASPAGLAADEALRRLQEAGPNELQEERGTPAWTLLLRQFQSVLVAILVAAALIAGLTGEWLDCSAVLAILLLNAALGFRQEYGAERAIAALRRMTAPQAKARRDGSVRVLPAREIVPGDVIEFEAGDLIPADARLLEAATLATIEAALTGESVPVEKRAGEELPPGTALGDRRNTVHVGTSVATGRGAAVVVATGMSTEIGGIAGLMHELGGPEQTPLQRELASFGKVLAWGAVGIVALVFAAGWLRGMPVLELLLTSVSLAVAAVPEGLPTVVTIALAVGVQRMAAKRALVRRLHAVETLGSANVICSDKTGTLTVGEMTVRALWARGRSYTVSGAGYAPSGEVVPEAGSDLAPARELLALLVGSSSATLREEAGVWSVVGDPTEGALLAAGAKLGITRAFVEREQPLVREFPFDSDRKCMSIVRMAGHGMIAMVKGAPDVVLARATHVATDAGVRPMTEADRAAISAEMRRMAERALRVLAAARRELETLADSATADDVERELVFVGLAGMVDPPRPEAREAVARCRSAGIRVVMITGDHRDTALAVARELGIAGSGDEVMAAADLEACTDEELRRRAPRVAVYARVTAAHKLRIVRAIQASGGVAAMTGDGVNDAPAIKAADIGVAMGRTGTEVTKEASDMVITDDDFATIVAAVQEGRGIYANIRKTILYLLSGNVGELLFVGLSVLACLPMPLTAVQLLWINLVTDGLPALCLATDPIDASVMRRPPRARSGGFADREFLRVVFLTGILSALTTLAVYVLSLRTEGEIMARAHAFSALVFIELLRSLSFRGDEPLWRGGLLGNLRLLAVAVTGMLVQLSLPHIGVFEDILGVPDMTMLHCLQLLGAAAVPVVLLEVLKTRKGAPRP